MMDHLSATPGMAADQAGASGAGWPESGRPESGRPESGQPQPGGSSAESPGYSAGQGGQPGQGGRADQADQAGQGDQAGQNDRGRQVGAWLESVGVRLTKGQAGSGPLRRDLDRRILGGVAAGISRRTGFDASAVRVVLIVATLLSTGFIAAAYVIAWLLIPADDAESNIGMKSLGDRRGIGLVAALTSVLVLGLIIASALNAPWITSLALPLIVSVDGLVLIWRNAPENEIQYLRDLTDPVSMASPGSRRARLARVVLAAALLVLGLVALLEGHERRAALRPLVGVLLVIGGIAIALGPWWTRIARDLVAERQARIRAEERADMASRVHDSVLQTLALIQRRSGDPQQVIQLARAQERELRAWLFDGKPPGTLDGQAATVADGIRLIQQEVEAQHGMTVDAVTVGDCDLDDDLSAMLAAGREATVNAAKWSGADVVSLFAEVEPEAVSLYVRDRGRGFEPDAVSADRKGLAESVRARMARLGGSATIRSAPGAGTEVTLVMPRSAGHRSPRRS